MSGRQLLERDSRASGLAGALDGAAAGAGRVVVAEGEAGIGKTSLLRAARGARGRRGDARAARAAAPSSSGRSRSEWRVSAWSRPCATRPSASACCRARRAWPSRSSLTGAPESVAGPRRWASCTASTARSWPTCRARPVLLAGRRCPLGGRAVAELPGLSGRAAPSARGARRGGPRRRGAGEQRPLDELSAVRGAVVEAPRPLSEAAVDVLAAETFGAPADPAFTRACVEATGGNPFLLVELAAGAGRDGARPSAHTGREVRALRPPAVVADVRRGRAPGARGAGRRARAGSARR